MQNLFDECFNSTFPARSGFGGSGFGSYSDPFQRMDAFTRASDDLFNSFPFSAGAQSSAQHPPAAGMPETGRLHERHVSTSPSPLHADAPSHIGPVKVHVCDLL